MYTCAFVCIYIKRKHLSLRTYTTRICSTSTCMSVSSICMSFCSIPNTLCQYLMIASRVASRGRSLKSLQYPTVIFVNATFPVHRADISDKAAPHVSRRQTLIMANTKPNTVIIDITDGLEANTYIHKSLPHQKHLFHTLLVHASSSPYHPISFHHKPTILSAIIVDYTFISL